MERGLNKKREFSVMCRRQIDDGGPIGMAALPKKKRVPSRARSATAQQADVQQRRPRALLRKLGTDEAAKTKVTDHRFTGGRSACSAGGEAKAGLRARAELANFLGKPPCRWIRVTGRQSAEAGRLLGGGHPPLALVG